MPHLCFSAFDVINLVALSSCDCKLLDFLWSCPFNVIDLHTISDVPWWSEWSLLDNCDLVLRVQGISTNPSSGEFDAVWLVNGLEIELWLVETYVQSSWT